MADQLALADTMIGGADLRRHGEGAAHLRQVRVMEVVAPDPGGDGRAVAIQDPRHLVDRHLCLSPAPDLLALLNA